jgi:hypothetical protein
MVPACRKVGSPIGNYHVFSWQPINCYRNLVMTTLLSTSRAFSHFYDFLNDSRRAVCIATAFVFFQSLLLAYSAAVHSPTLNEPAHLAAGISHWQLGRFELYRVNPPFVRMVAALPVLCLGVNEDWSAFVEGVGARPEFVVGEKFVSANRERLKLIFWLARLACLPFSWIGAATCYLWARDLYGRPAGVLSCAIWCFEPTILGNASLLTADIGGTAMGTAACYTFWCWLQKPSWFGALTSGIVLGIAELCKTTLIVLMPLWPLIWLLYRLTQPSKFRTQPLTREIGMLLLRILIAVYVVNLGYGYEGSMTPLGDYHFVSHLCTGNLDDNSKVNLDTNSIAANNSPLQNRFAGSLVGRLPVPLPRNYILGIDIQRRAFEKYTRPFYLAGEWRDTGWIYYYLYASAIKLPLPIWLIAGLLLCFRSNLAVMRHQPQMECWKGIMIRDELVLLAPGFVIFIVVSLQTGINEHFRYALPAFPYFIIALSQIARLYSWQGRHSGVSCQ